MADELGGALLARYWWAIAIRGLAALVFGILAFLLPALTLATLVLLLAAYLITDAIFAVVASGRAIRHHQGWWSLLLEGLFDAIAAVAVLLWPGLTALVLIWVIAAWAIFSGVAALVSAAALPMAHGRVWQALSGVISVLLGIAMIILPVAGALAVVYWIAFYAILFGIFQVALAVRLHRRHHGIVHSHV